MQFGVMLLADLPVKRLLDLAKRSEEVGFDYFWLNDCDILFENPWPTFALIAEHTERIKIGPLVTNPVTRDWTVTGGLFATLNEIAGGRMVCGVGRGDATVRLLGKPPSSVAEFERFIQVVRDLVGGREVSLGEQALRIEWTPGWEMEMWGAGYGPKALEVVGRTCNGFVIQAGDPSMVAWTSGFVREAAKANRRSRDAVRVMVGAPAYVTDDVDHAHDQTRWFGGVVANHIAELAERYEGLIPADLTSIFAGRDEYEFAVRGASGHTAAEYITNETNDRFALIGPVDRHLSKLRKLREVGADVFTLYLNHDGIDQTLDAYAESVLPEMK